MQRLLIVKSKTEERSVDKLWSSRFLEGKAYLQEIGGCSYATETVKSDTEKIQDAYLHFGKIRYQHSQKMPLQVKHHNKKLRC